MIRRPVRETELHRGSLERSRKVRLSVLEHQRLCKEDIIRAQQSYTDDLMRPAGHDYWWEKSRNWPQKSCREKFRIALQRLFKS